MDDLKFAVVDQEVDAGAAATYVLDEDDVAVAAGKTAVVTISEPAEGVTYTVSSRTFAFTAAALSSLGTFEVSGKLADGTGESANSIDFSFQVSVVDPLIKEATLRSLVASKDDVVRKLVPLYLKATLTSGEKTTVLELERKLEGLEKVLLHLQDRYSIIR